MNRMKPRPAPGYPIRLPHRPEPEGLDLGAVFGALGRSKWLILGCTLAATSTGFLALSDIRPSYFSSAEVLLDTRQERVVGVEQVVSDLNVTNSVVAGEIAVLRSNLLLGQVVDELDLMSHPDFDPDLADDESLLGRAGVVLRTWLAGFWSGVSAPEPMPEAENQSDEDGKLSEADARNIVIWKVRSGMTVYQSGISYVISISMAAHDPKVASDIANAVARQYIQDQLHAKQAATQRAIEWLDTRLMQLQKQLQDAEDAVVDALAQQVVEDGGNEEGVSQQLGEMNRSVVAARNDRAAAEARLTHVQQMLAEDGPEVAAASLNTARLTALDSELASITRERAKLATRLGPRHPDLLSLNVVFGDLMRDRAAAIRAGVRELESEVAQAEGRQLAIEKDIGKAQALKVDLLRSSIRMNQLERSANAMRQVYNSFLSRFQETTQQLEFQRPDARIISEAEPALAPSRPRKPLVLAVSVTLGAILGVTIALIREAMNRTVRTAQELSQLTGLPVFGTLPTVRWRGRGGGAAWQRARLSSRKVTAYAEGLRLLRFGLMNDPENGWPRVVMLTAPERGAGCSTTALGLGRTLVDIGQRVVLLDADFHRPSLAQLLQVPVRGPGVVEYIAGQAEVSDIVIADAEPGLALVRVAPSSGSVADMLSARRFGTLLDELVARYDVVIIDAPPVSGLADTTVIAGLTDAVVLVARARGSNRAEISAAVAALRTAGAVVSGTILSRADSRAVANGTVAAPDPIFSREVEFHA
ncbi:polysaccharide biosynthesis tyrosine autokinase (plasmid) [Salipiger sp. H15]|uniref:Polysaccharide biosynthesis tyrosine autokinase n=1 Tax=Alloyangia sp. H15 TaxID=3029062 RepID=A0AAU8ASJ3_9RHOB